MGQTGLLCLTKGSGSTLKKNQGRWRKSRFPLKLRMRKNYYHPHFALHPKQSSCKDGRKKYIIGDSYAVFFFWCGMSICMCNKFPLPLFFKLFSKNYYLLLLQYELILRAPRMFTCSTSLRGRDWQEDSWYLDYVTVHSTFLYNKVLKQLTYRLILSQM